MTRYMREQAPRNGCPRTAPLIVDHHEDSHIDSRPLRFFNLSDMAYTIPVLGRNLCTVDLA